jgi:predicted O-methyltransferase YrrM
MNNYKYISKLKSFFYEDIKNIKNISILEFGVREGNSTKFFLEICDKNNGKLYSVDINDFSHLFKKDNWKFIHSSDDDFEKVIRESQKSFDLILIDSFHDPDHVKKLIFYYFQFLKKNGMIIIDDISWIPYCKNSYRDHFHSEIINRNTFSEILNILFNNRELIKVYFSFEDSGLSKIVKLSNEPLKMGSVIKSREYSIKNILKNFLKKND